MRILHSAARFTSNKHDLLVIYKSFIRSKLEQSASVWHNSLTKQNEIDLERVQKSALKVILKEKYQDYDNALKLMDLESLFDRRESICLKFAKKALRLEHFKKMFPIQKHLHGMDRRNKRKYIENNASTERYKKSAIPSMQRLLNKYQRDVNGILKSLLPVSNNLYHYDSFVEKF